MATPPRGLALVLTIGMEAWLAAPIHTGSPGSGWWGTQEALTLRHTARRSTLKGDYAETERIYRRGAELATRHHDPVARAWFLTGVGDSRFASFDYRGALAAYLEARGFAERARDPVSLGAIDFDLASLYQQMWDFDSALRAAEEGQRVTKGAAGVYYRAQLLLLLGRLRGARNSIPLFQEAIESARSASSRDPSQAAVEALAWHYLGAALLDGGDLEGAAAAEQNALLIRQKRVQRDLGESYWALGGLRLKQAEGTTDAMVRQRLLLDAEGLTRRAAHGTAGPKYLLQLQLGQVLLAQGRIPEGLEALESSIQQAQEWRTGISAAVSSADGAAEGHQVRIFDGFIRAAADYGIQTHSQRWIEESFEASELNRAIDLRDSARSRWRSKLPVEYWEVLGKLEAKQAQLPQVRSGAKDSEAESLKLKLTELEAGSELGYSRNIAENFPSRASLNHFRRSLKDSEILLSFALGEQESFLWAVTRDTFNVYRLPPGERIVKAVRDFRHEVEADSLVAGANNGFEDLGEQLYEMLFGQLKPRETARPAWLLSAGDALLELPFGALMVEPREGSGPRVFLAERHSLEITAGALLPGGRMERPRRGVVLVGDPIYNVADPRWADRGSTWRSGGSWFSMSGWTGLGWTGRPPGNQLNRLPGSRQEIEASAEVWNGERTVVLEGASASRGEFLKALSPVPQVIHLATHALNPGSGDDAYLAFTLDRDGSPEILTTFEIRTLDVPGSVVVMTGCSTAPSDVRAGLGLAGLVRAWTVAGASAVVATEWPVQDASGGSLLSGFYRYLRNHPEAQAAEALRVAQAGTIHSGTPEAAPAVWAAYQVFTGPPEAGRDLP